MYIRKNYQYMKITYLLEVKYLGETKHQWPKRQYPQIKSSIDNGD